MWYDAFVSLFRLLFPRQCLVCGAPLGEGEELMCVRCNIAFPRTHCYERTNNEIEKMFWGKFDIVHATSYFYYAKGSPYSRLVHCLKYRNRPDIGKTLGRFAAAELLAGDFFDDIDLIIPVPLHPARYRQRGYNQSEQIALGLSAVTHIPVDTAAVERVVDTESQTRKSVFERTLNVHNIFRVPHPAAYAGLHLLLIDDVLTTGSTLTACADAFAGVPGVRFSIFTLTFAGG